MQFLHLVPARTEELLSSAVVPLRMAGRFGPERAGLMLVTYSKTMAGNVREDERRMNPSRRQMWQIFTGLGVGLIGGSARKGRAQTSPLSTPNYALLSNAVINNNGVAAGSVWTGTNAGSLKSDDLVRASTLVRLTADHFEEIGVNAYLNTQLSQPPSGAISPIVVHAIGEQLRSYGILLTDAQIQQQYYSPDPTAQQQGLLYATQVGIRALQYQIADSLNLAAEKLRLQEIATACGDLLPLLPSAHVTPLTSTSSAATGRLPPRTAAQSYCSEMQTTINGEEAALAVATNQVTAIAAGLGGLLCVGTEGGDVPGCAAFLYYTYIVTTLTADLVLNEMERALFCS